MSERKLLAISQSARYLGVTPHTLRLWERKGILKPTTTTPSGHRRYSVFDLDQLKGKRLPSAEAIYFSEKEATKMVVEWLRRQGFEVTTPTRGPDVIAEKGIQKWVIEVKGSPTTYAEENLSACLAVGETLKRMEVYGNSASYFIAAPAEIVSKLPATLHDHGIGVILVSELNVEILSKGELQQFAQPTSDEETRGKGFRVAVPLYKEELETLDDLARIANLPPVRAEHVRFAIRQLRWTYGSALGRILTDIERVLTELKKTLEEEES